MARRFLRSVIRVFIVLTAQASPDKMAARHSLYNQSAIAKCRRAFTVGVACPLNSLEWLLMSCPFALRLRMCCFVIRRAVSNGEGARYFNSISSLVKPWL